MQVIGLVVDDDPQIRSLLADFLRRRGMEVLEAKSGNEALALTQSVSPAFVVTDLEMADGDGLELCRRLRGSVVTAKVHIVVVSGDAATQAEAATAAGCDVVLAKPCSPLELLRAIEHLLAGPS